MAATKKKDEVAIMKLKTTVPAQDLAALMAQDSGGGMEGTDRDSFAIPFLRVLQQLSPQCTKGNSAYMPDAEPGMILNTVTNELSGEDGLIFIPCAFQRRFIQWGPRGGEGGGYKGELLPEDVALKRASGEIKELDGELFVGEPNPKKSDRIVDTRNHFGLVMTDVGASQALLSLSSTQIKKSKQLMAILSSLRINGTTPPTWASKIRLSTVMESNDRGSWYGLKLEHAGFVDDPDTYAAGKAFYQVIGSGKAKVDYATEHGKEETGF
jgi:hypothetical protein